MGAEYVEELKLRHLTKLQQDRFQYCGILVGVIFLSSFILLVFLLWIATDGGGDMKNWDELPGKETYYLYSLVFVVFVFLFTSYTHWIAYNQFQRNY